MEEKFVRDRALVFLQKNKDYGDSFKESIDIFGGVAGKVRILDKVNRIHSLLSANVIEVKEETILDTILDLVNYVAMYRSIEDNEYTLYNLCYYYQKFAQFPDGFIDTVDEILEPIKFSGTNADIVKDILSDYIVRL